MIDIDRFRAVNEELGHLGGDAALRELAARVGKHIRKEELFARYGGEEFAVVLPETSPDGAIQLGERLRCAVQAQPFTYDNKSYAVTISLGVATTSGDEPVTPSELIRMADEKLYQAKHEGRNRVVA
jgi:diguanylate cyclase (GGDEF)-like protein